MSWIVEKRFGLHLPQIEWWLDATRSVARSFVSHAHSDHLGRHREVICTPPTARFMRERLGGKRTVHALPFGRAEALTSDASITLFPAGHMLGSALCLIEHAEHGRLLYTGDFKLRAGRSAEACATPRADLLIMETTFGKPHYLWPPIEETLAGIARFCRDSIEAGANPVLFAYSLGKSQELLACLAESGLPIMLHAQILRYTRIYEELGAQFPPYAEFDASRSGGKVIISPPLGRGSAFLAKIPSRRTAVVSGWALDRGAVYRYGCDAAFPLSDHADFSELLNFVERVGPRRVLTVHGFADEFAQMLRSRGIEASAAGRDTQLELTLKG